MGVQCRGGLVHEQHFGLHGQGAGDAKALLLAARHAQGALVQPVLHLVPDGGAPQAPLHDLVQLGLVVDAVGARTVGDVVVDGHGEGVGLLEHHAHALAQHVDIHFVLVDVHAVQQDVARDAAALHQVVHPVQALQEGGFTAARRSDEGGDLLLGDGDVDIFQGMEAAVVQIHVFHFKFIHGRSLSFQCLASLRAMKLDRQLMASTSTSSTTAVP